MVGEPARGKGCGVTADDELAVRNVVHGEPVNNIEALANPEALDDFRNRKELEV